MFVLPGGSHNVRKTERAINANRPEGIEKSGARSLWKTRVRDRAARSVNEARDETLASEILGVRNSEIVRDSEILGAVRI